MDTKCLHISGNNAIRLMRAARAGDIVRATPCDDAVVHSWEGTRSGIESLGIGHLTSWLNVSPSKPLELLVPNTKSRLWMPEVRNLVFTSELPPGAFLEIEPGASEEYALKLPRDVRVLIEGPALSFIRAAHYLQSHQNDSSKATLRTKLRLIALASEFCGHYARNPLAPENKPCHYEKPAESERFYTTDKLVAFLRDAPPLPGLTLARQLAKHVIDGSGSPMETFCNLGWTLPPRLAGLSMPKPLANKELQTKNKAVRALLNHDLLHPDFQWPELGVLGEYLGDKEHASHRARTEDKNRLQDFTISDYKSFFLMYDDVKNATAFNNTALMFAHAFAKAGMKREPSRLRKLMEDKDFKARQLKLLQTLLPPLARFDEV